MPTRLKPYIFVLLALLGIPALLLLGVWIWFLLLPNPLLYEWAQYGVWPIACSSRGCVTTGDWSRQYKLSQTYAAAVGGDVQTEKDALETAIHHHLLAHASFKSPVTLAQAERYREQVLNIHALETVKKVVGVSTQDYDRYVILPFLQQEALRQERKVESTDELYALLGQDRFIVSLLRYYRWDRTEGALR